MADTSILACIDLDVYLADPTSDAAKAECEKAGPRSSSAEEEGRRERGRELTSLATPFQAALALQSTGALVLKTSRVTPSESWVGRPSEASGGEWSRREE